MKQLSQLLGALREKLSPRERLAVAWALAALVAVVTWSLLIAPPWRQLTSALAQRQALDQVLQTMQAQAVEAAQLKADTALVEANYSKTLQAATQQHLAVGSQALIAGDKATVTVVATSAEGLTQWFSTVRQNAHAKPLEAHLTKTGTLWAGTVVLSLPVKATAP